MQSLRDDVVDLARSGHPVGQIAAMVGRNHCTISKLLKAAGFERERYPVCTGAPIQRCDESDFSHDRNRRDDEAVLAEFIGWGRFQNVGEPTLRAERLRDPGLIISSMRAIALP